jgi:branched-chain amino acid transport system permease protein
MKNFGIVAKVNGLLATNPVLSIGILILTLALAVVVGEFVGYLGSYPALGLIEAYLGIKPLAIGDLIMTIPWNYEPLVGGTNGVFVIEPFSFVGGKTKFTVAALVALGIAILL